MLRYPVIFCLLLFSIVGAHAQTVFSGRVLENKTRVVLHGVIVENLSNKLKAITDDGGRFSIGAKTGDLLVLKLFSYQPDTVLLTDLHDREIFMEPVRNMLKQVDITDSTGHAVANKNAVQLYDPQFHGQTVVYHRDKDHNFDGGVIFRLHYFKGDEHDKKKALKKEQERQLSLEISTIFTADNIAHYIPLKDADLDNFLLLYTPDLKVYNSKDFNLTAYLSASYDAWQKLTPEQQKAGQIFKKQ